MGWSSFPKEHKKRLSQGLMVYLLLSGGVAAWINLESDDTIRDWQNRIPSAKAEIKDVYVTPQITLTEKEVAPLKTTPPVDVTATTPAQPPADNETVFLPPADGKAYVSIIVSGLGLSAMNTERALNDLPSKVALAFSPYGEDVQEWIGKANKMNRETFILMPMETAAYPQDDPGPRAVSSRFSDKENEENLKWLLAQGKGATGIINLMGSRFLTDPRRLFPLFSTLQKNKSMFIEMPGIANSAAAAIAGQTSLPYLAADMQIDAKATDADIRQKLSELEKTARARGYAVGIADPYPLTFNVIKSWAAQLEAHGITLVSPNTLLKNKPRYEVSPPPQEQLQQP